MSPASDRSLAIASGNRSVPVGHRAPLSAARSRRVVWLVLLQPGRSDEQITEVVTAPRSPWQNAYVERVLGSIRRECLDHMVIFNERHLRRVLSSYVNYYQGTRTHLFTRQGLSRPAPNHATQDRKG